MVYSIIQKSQLEGALRIDAEYYQPDFLKIKKSIENFSHVNFGDIIDVLTDYHANGSYEILNQNVKLSDEPDFALMIRTTDLENDNFNKNVRYISEKAYNFLKKTKVFGGEIIINKIGSAGRVYLMPELDRKVSLGMNQFMIRLKDNINTNYVYVFLISKYGEKLISQLITGAVPQSIDKDSVRSIKIPVFSQKFQKEIEDFILRGCIIKNNSFNYYKQAVKMLTEELGLNDFGADKILFSVVNLSEVENANRIDAEYFQEKYKKLVKKIKLNNAKKLGDLVSIKKGFEPGSEEYYEEGKLFIRVSSLSVNGINLTEEKYLSEKLYQELKNDYEPKVGEILLTKDASPGIAYAVKEPVEGIMSGGILRLKLKENIEAEYLTLCLNSIVGQMQAERDAGGSVIAHWRPEQIKNIMIPILSKETQQKIADLVRKSHEARKKAKELLEEAKRKVEEMIENKK